MKKIIFIFVLMGMFSCSEYINQPKNLISKDKMSEIIADMAINDQVIFTYPGKNLESGTRFILKTHHVKSEDFVLSYQYYIAQHKMNGILEKAQIKILEKDPTSENKIKKGVINPLK